MPFTLNPYKDLKRDSILQFSLYVLLLVVVFVAIAFAVFSGAALSFVAFDQLKALTWVSMGLFVVVFLTGFFDRRLYYFFLLFVLLAFPSPINDIMPGILPGQANERNMAPFPFITQIDLYLLLGVFLNLYHNRFKLNLFSSWLLIIGVIVLFVPSLVNIIQSPNVQEAALVVSGLFQIRFLLLMVLLVSTQNILPYQKQILMGLVFSIAFLFLEAIANTKMNHIDRLASGTLSLNTFGNIVAASLVCMVMLLRKTRFYKTPLWIGIGIAFVIVVLTQNRMSLVAIPAAFILYYFLRQRGVLNNTKSLVVILMVVGLGYFYFPKIEQVLPARFALSEILEKTKFNAGGSLLDVEQSEATSTLFTRLLLFKTSGKMIEAHPFIGIGVGRWNYYKEEYGFPAQVLIDSHNGLAALLSQYGLFSLLFAYIIYLYPVFIFLKNRALQNEPLAYLAVINLTMLICDLTNAGIFKYQVFAFLAFNLAVLISLRFQQNGERDFEPENPISAEA